MVKLGKPDYRYQSEPLTKDARIKLFEEAVRSGTCSKNIYMAIRDLGLNIDHKVVYIRKVQSNPFGKGALKSIELNEGEICYLRKNRVFAMSKELGLIKILGITTASKVKKLYTKAALENTINNESNIVQVFEEDEVQNEPA